MAVTYREVEKVPEKMPALRRWNKSAPSARSWSVGSPNWNES